jgi:hypothetical protein
VKYRAIRMGVSAVGIFASALAMAGTTTVTGSSGQTTVTQTVGSSGWWEANSSAETATITYDDSIQVFSGSRHPFGMEFKCIQNGVFGPKTLTGLSDFISDASGAAGVSTGGNTTFSDPTPGVPRFYQTNWVSTVTTSGVGSDAASNTYDPWKYTASALQGIGVAPGAPTDIYFQVRLGAGSAVITGAGEKGELRFGAYATTWNSTTIPFLMADVKRTPGGVAVSTSQSNDPNITIYRLPSAVALNDALSPTAKTGLGTLMGAGGVQSNFTGNLSGIGALIDDLHFGIIVHGFVTPVGLGPDDVVFATHFDTYAQVGPVPEPTTMLVLGAGALALLRRRARRS